ncbi:UDP-glucose dehydrogenase family protein [Bosea sp. NBC_00550]|uniref:UDP-glucose dehydrogenase family protein n=1 Tax=Bosea sp. NBC_00550 TaxID=2969621 RepID=UPI002232220C|nr:UDP-glucose/GDP-mannose dehydrogenase family protein [Bosea sp. NBC_00550]UZF91281.1 UDP-glucose/GDP-mannose dehydrogenase family protein [Bosea sp. NBC_00550]
MRLVMVGSGYVGLVSGVCFADFGHDVVCVDKDPAKIARLQAGEVPIFEPGLDALMEANVKAGRLSFTTDLPSAAGDADAIFIAVGTPTRRGDGHADLSYVYAAAREIAGVAAEGAVIVTKSTVPVGTGDEVERIVAEVRPGAGIAVVSNPEFLREGAAIEDFKRPDRIVVGTDEEHARKVMTEIYRPLYINQGPLIFVNRRTSELIKYAANAFLAMKITFINEMADLCEKVDADVQDVARGIGLDNRIGSKFLHAGPGYGGSCFPKDTLALVKTAQHAESPVRLIETVVSVNDLRKKRMAQKVIAACGGSVAGKRVAVLGLAFKPNTDDMRDAPSLDILPMLQQAGAEIIAYDPESMEQARPLLPGITFASGAYDCLEDADALVIITEWNAFRALDLKRVKAALKRPIVIDLRNIYRPNEMAALGFSYHGVGRKD